MSGTLNWASDIALESDLGTQNGGHGGSAAYGGGAGAWDWDCGWGIEVIPLEYAGFTGAVSYIENGTSTVSLTPAVPEPATMIIWSFLSISAGLGLHLWQRKIRPGVYPSNRTPWSDETRMAIHQIIERGRVW
jgi:hypothetical protein